jgi:hypothetical protein
MTTAVYIYIITQLVCCHTHCHCLCHKLFAMIPAELYQMISASEPCRRPFLAHFWMDKFQNLGGKQRIVIVMSYARTSSSLDGCIRLQVIFQTACLPSLVQQLMLLSIQCSSSARACVVVTPARRVSEREVCLQLRPSSIQRYKGRRCISTCQGAHRRTQLMPTAARCWFESLHEVSSSVLCIYTAILIFNRI